MGYGSVGPVGDSGSSISDTHTSRRTHPSPCRLHRQPIVPVTTQRLEEQNHSLEDISILPRNGGILSAAFLVHLPMTPSAPHSKPASLLHGGAPALPVPRKPLQLRALSRHAGDKPPGQVEAPGHCCI